MGLVGLVLAEFVDGVVAPGEWLCPAASAVGGELGPGAVGEVVAVGFAPPGDFADLQVYLRLDGIRALPPILPGKWRFSLTPKYAQSLAFDCYSRTGVAAGNPWRVIAWGVRHSCKELQNTLAALSVKAEHDARPEH